MSEEHRVPGAGGGHQGALFDSREVYAEHVAGRVLIYLDTSAWAALADAKTKVASICADRCGAAVDAGVALFPLGFGSIGEVLEHPETRVRSEQARLMDQLSRGVTFRSHRQVYDLETFSVAARLVSVGPPPAPREILFSYVIEFVGDGTVSFGDLPPEDAAAFLERLREHPAARSVAWWAERPDVVDKFRERHAASKSSYAKNMTSKRASTRSYFTNADGSMNRERAVREEREYIWKAEVVPRLAVLLRSRLSESERDRVREFLKGDGVNAQGGLGRWLALMPSADLFCELMAARTMNPTRAVEPSDFWDVEHATATAYADAFVTLDRGLFDLVANRCKGPKARGCRLMRGVEQLSTYLETLMKPEPVQA